MVLMNAVNLRYEDTWSPRVKLLLTGYEINQDETYKSGTGNHMHDQTTLTNLITYAGGRKHAHGYPDVVYLMTGYDVYSTDASGNGNTNTLGVAYIGGVCTAYNVGLGEDKAGFYEGIYTIAHEVAHSLGAVHDGDPPQGSDPYHPGAVSCPWSAGNIMSYLDLGPSRHRFSLCSVQQMQYVLRLRGQPCWKTTQQSLADEDRYPGELLAANEFCRNVFPNQKDVTADLTSPVLKQCKVRCQYPVYQRYNWYGHLQTLVRYVYLDSNALDYMPCGDGYVCIRGLCVQEPVKTSKRPTLPKPKPIKPQQPPSTVKPREPDVPLKPPISGPSSPSPTTCECQCPCAEPVTQSRKDVHFL
ncbi:A disintegrin and metalloproteinase with thrombospondin motifs like [Haemaphysalis longicornis]